VKIWGTRHQGSPRRLAVYLEEKGLTVPFVPVDLRKGEHRTPAFLARNPVGLVPVLELDDGTCLTETIAIARYFEDVFPDPPFFGRTPRERARLEEAARLVEFGFYDSVRGWFRHGSPFARALEPIQVPEWAALCRTRADAALAVLDARLASSEFVGGDAFSWADITLVTSLEGTLPAGYSIPDGCANLRRWFDRISHRPSVVATRTEG